MIVKYIGFKDRMLRFEVELNGHTFDYSQGVGHAFFTSLSKDRLIELNELSSDDHIINVGRYDIPDEHLRHIKGFKKQGNSYNDKVRTIVKYKDVQACLYSDTQAGNMSFDEFCDNFGYSNDSFKAFDIYKACMDTVRKMRGFKYFDGIEDY